MDTVGSESRFFGYKAGYEVIVDFFDIGRAQAIYGDDMRVLRRWTLGKQAAEPVFMFHHYQPDRELK
jgi:hypothetical protein